MKVCYINLADNGSTGHICRSLADNDKINSLIFVGTKTTDNKNIVQVQSTFGKTVHRIVSGIFDYDDIGSIMATKNMLKRIQEFSPDIIHLHNLHGYYVNYKVLFDYIKKNNIKVVWTLHDCWPFTGHCAYFDIVRCNKWESGCKQCANLKEYPKSLIFDRSKKLYNKKREAFSGIKNMTLVCPSKWIARLVKKSFLRHYRVEVINNGINLDNFSLIDEKSFDNIVDRKKKIILGVASPFDNRKGYFDFIKLSKLIDKKKYQIVMVGVNQKQDEELRNYGIIGIERTENQKQLAELYSISYIFFNPTYQDNYPTVNIEALACGCPIITYNTGGSPEVIKENNGFVVNKGDINAVINLLELCGKFERDKIVTQAHMQHSKESMNDRYLELYKELLKTN